MTDTRQKQPDQRHIDLWAKTSGQMMFETKIETWPYSGLRNEDVYSRELTIGFRADSFGKAARLAEAFATIIALGHDVWQANVRHVCESGHHAKYRQGDTDNA